MTFDEQRMKNKILRKIEREINQSFLTYFSYAWRENLNEMLTTESKYSKLVNWINKEIEHKMSTANLFSPADKTEDYKTDFYNTFRDLLSDVALLIYLREILLDERTTTQMRENVEYTIEKVFGTKYSEYLEDYV